MRDFVRHPTDIPIEVRVLDLPKEQGAMTSVSEGGVSCLVNEKIRVGSQVEIKILSVSPPYQGLAEVMWCRREDGRYEVGLRFSDHQEAFKSRMVQQVCQIEQYKNLIYERDGRLLNGDEAAAEWIAKYAADFN